MNELLKAANDQLREKDEKIRELRAQNEEQQLQLHAVSNVTAFTYAAALDRAVSAHKRAEKVQERAENAQKRAEEAQVQALDASKNALEALGQANDAIGRAEELVDKAQAIQNFLLTAEQEYRNEMRQALKRAKRAEAQVESLEMELAKMKKPYLR